MSSSDDDQIGPKDDRQWSRDEEVAKLLRSAAIKLDEAFAASPNTAPQSTFYAFGAYHLYREMGLPVPEHVLKVFDGIVARADALLRGGSVPVADRADPFRWVLGLDATFGRGNAFGRERTRATKVDIWGVMTEALAKTPNTKWTAIDAAARERSPHLDLDTVSTYRKQLIRDLVGPNGGAKLRKAAERYREHRLALEDEYASSFSIYLIDCNVVDRAAYFRGLASPENSDRFRTYRDKP